MTSSSRSSLLVTLALVLIVPAPAAGADFTPAQALDLPVRGQLAAAVGADGEAVVAGARGDLTDGRVAVATRAGSGARWKTTTLGAGGAIVRDVQAVIGRRGSVLAWSEIGRRGQAIVIATAAPGGDLAVRARMAVTNASSAFPRLALLRSGAVVVAWRDGRSGSRRARVRVATIDGNRFASAPRTAGTGGATQIVLAARGAGAAVGWVSRHRSLPRKTRLSVRRVAPRTLTIRLLDARGLPAGDATIAGRDIGATARLAGAPDGRLVASWLRPQKIRPYPGEDEGAAPPPTAYINQAAFTRQVLPRLLPARPLPVPSGIAGSVPSVAFDAAGHAVAALSGTAVPNTGPAYDALTAGSTAGGPWSSPQLVAHLGFSRFNPVVVAPASGPVVVYSALLQAPGAPSWAVGASDASGPQVLGATSAGDGRGIAVARAGERVLVAWPSATGGVDVAERG